MKREIKFRGLYKNVWVYGFYAFDEEWAKHYIYHLEKKGAYFVLGRTEVDSESVQQSTGLKDKNKIAIFEGDVVNCWDNAADDPQWMLDVKHTGVIEYVGAGYSLRCLNANGEPVYLKHWDNAENIEVIGNIHQNPELLKS